MTSLSAHFRSGDSHDALAFHPSCPICVEHRLTGKLTAAAIFPLRVQAAIAAGLVAVAATGPAVAASLAAENDSGHEGTSPVSQTAPEDSAASTAFDPGGDTSGLPEQSTPSTPAGVAPAPAGPTIASGAQPATEQPEPVVDAGDGSEPGPQTATQPTSSETAASTTTEPANATQTITAPPAAPTPTAADPDTASTPAATAPDASTKPAKAKPHVARHHSVTHIESHTKQTAPPNAAAVPAATTAPTVSTPQPTTAIIAPAQRAVRSAAVHVVVPGESLWAIASDLLGAHASPARVAREVHRLWELNRARIATGDPDLLLAGTRLALR